MALLMGRMIESVLYSLTSSLFTLFHSFINHPPKSATPLSVVSRLKKSIPKLEHYRLDFRGFNFLIQQSLQYSRIVLFFPD